MITMTNEQIEKINLLDRIFGAMDVEQLKTIAESEQIVARLKGTDANPGILHRLIQEHDMQAVDMMNLKGELSALKNDMKELMRVLNSTLFTVPYSQEFQNLKSKHSVY